MFGIDMGPSKQENSQYNNLTAASGFATGAGESDLTASNTFMQDILSGDPTKVSQALAPEISGQQKQVQQQKDQAAQFGSRSGGTAATIANADTAGRSNIINLEGGLMGHSADSLASTGTSLLGTGISGDATGFGEASKLQAQRAAKFNDIFSSSASLAAGVLGALPGAAGGFLDAASNIAGGMS
jgi:hypothetical protein